MLSREDIEDFHGRAIDIPARSLCYPRSEVSMCGSAPSMPAPITPPPAPEMSDPAIIAAQDRERKRQQAARAGKTLLTPQRDAQAAPQAQGMTAPKTLLGE